MSKFPLQPIVKDQRGQPRFKGNKIIIWLFENHAKGATLDLNKIACMDFPDEDREQLAMLLGYSLGGFSELSYVSNETYEAAMLVSKTGVSEQEARLESQRAKLSLIRESLRKVVPELFAVHPDDLRDLQDQ